jgi:nucleotide-binding universal stress UspA family protein
MECAQAHLGLYIGANLCCGEVSAMPDTVMEGWARPAVILVATDLSDLDRLMPFAFEEAEDTGARLILLHVLATASAPSVDAMGMPSYNQTCSPEFAEKTLEHCCLAAHKRKIACDKLLREGNVAQQIAAACRQFHVDRVMLGTRSRSKIGKLLLGSVVEKVLRSVNSPVMTVGPEAHLPVGNSDRQRAVLYATTLRETSRPSAALACQIAASQGYRLVLLHVLPPVDEMERKGLPTGLDSTALHELRILAQETGAGSTIAVEAHVVHGNPSIEILAEAAERGASLIALGATLRSAFENLTRDRTIYRVLAHARCPVLTLREPLTHPAGSEAEQLAFHQ